MEVMAIDEKALWASRDEGVKQATMENGEVHV